MSWRIARNLLTRLLSRNCRPSCPTRLKIERLECRVTPAILKITATTSLVSVLSTATAGDTVQIEPNAVIGTVGTTGSLVNSSSVGDTQIVVTGYFAPGQVIDIDTTGTTETDLVNAVSPAVPTPGASSYTLTLNDPLADSHTAGATVTAEAGTLGISQGITLQGDASKPVSGLLTGYTIDVFPEYGTLAPQAINHLSLGAVQTFTGTAASSNLTLSGDTFNETAALNGNATAAINVQVSGGSLTLTGDTVTAGAAANLGSAILGSTTSGTITYSGNTVTVAGPLTGDGVSLHSNTGTVNVTGASVTAGSTVGDDLLDVSAGGNISLAGTTTLSAGGSVGNFGLDAEDGGSTTIGSVALNVTGNITNIGVYVNTNNLTVGSVSVTLTGSLTDSAILLLAGGEATLGSLKASVGGSTPYGVETYIYGSQTDTGPISAQVTGAVAIDGVSLFSYYGTLSVSGSVTATLASSVGTDGVNMEAGYQSLLVTGPVTATIGGTVGENGVGLQSFFFVSVNAVTVSLAGVTNDDGISINGPSVAVNGPLTVTANDSITGTGVNVVAGGAMIVTGAVAVSISGSTSSAVDLNAGSLTDSGAVTAAVTGNVSGNAVEESGTAGTVIRGKIKVTVGGSADAALDVEAVGGALSDVAGVVASVSGPVLYNAAYFASGGTTSLANINITAPDVGSGTGLYVKSQNGAEACP